MIEQEIVYVRYVNSQGHVSTKLADIVDLEYGNAKGVKDGIFQGLDTVGLSQDTVADKLVGINTDGSAVNMGKTRNVSMGHGCPRYCQIRINRALSLTRGHNSNNNWWILCIIELDLYFMITYLCMKYESNTPMFSKDIVRKPFFIMRSRAITLIIVG